MEPSQEELLFSKINYNLTTFFLWNMTENRNVWSVVFFSQAVPDPVAILDARAELKAEIAFAAYGDVEADMNLPPLGAMAIQSKNILERASKRHPIFMRAFRLLEGYSDRKNWVGLIDIQNELSI